MRGLQIKIESRDAKKVLSNLDNMILAIKATGGYKERKKLHLTDLEIDKLCANSEPSIRKMAISLVVAEDMLQEPAPSIHSRWEEYERRRGECMEELGKKK